MIILLAAERVGRLSGCYRLTAAMMLRLPTSVRAVTALSAVLAAVRIGGDSPNRSRRMRSARPG
jgi:hypothetical protein